MKDGPPGQTPPAQPPLRPLLPPQRSTPRLGVPRLLTFRSSRPHLSQHSPPAAASQPARPPNRASHHRRT
eukprot:5630445-Heterocapsa_arctica.AAC.1